MAAPEGYTKLGNVGYADKGVYSADATYNKYNAVYHEGSTYVALKDNLHGVTPADGANWRYMAKGFTEASADAITVIDTSGIIDGTKNKKTILQTFLDKVGDFIINKAVTNDALMLKLADYLKKTDIVQTESTATNKVPSSAYLKQVKDNIDSNLVNLNDWSSSVIMREAEAITMPSNRFILFFLNPSTTSGAYARISVNGNNNMIRLVASSGEGITQCVSIAKNSQIQATAISGGTLSYRFMGN